MVLSTPLGASWEWAHPKPALCLGLPRPCSAEASLPPGQSREGPRVPPHPPPTLPRHLQSSGRGGSMSFKQFLCEHKMAALNKCNPAQLLILHIIKFLIYTLCFRGPTHNSLVLNSRGIKTNARRAPGRSHLPGLTAPASGAGRKAREGRQGAHGAEARARVSPGCQAPRCRPRSKLCGRGSVGASSLPSLTGLEGARARALPHAHAHAHTRTRGWPRGALSGAGLLGRHLPVGGFQTSRESQKLHGLQTPESLAGPGPLPTPDAAPPLGAGPGTHPRAKRARRRRGEIRGARGLPEVPSPFRPGDRRPECRAAQPGLVRPGWPRATRSGSGVEGWPPLSRGRRHQGAAHGPRPRPGRPTRRREAGAGKGLGVGVGVGGKGSGPCPGARPQAGARRPAVPAAQAGNGLAPRRASQGLEVLRAFPAESQPRALAEREGGGRARAPPSPPAVTGAITLLAADGYQLARASLSPPLLPSPPLPSSAELLAPS